MEAGGSDLNVLIVEDEEIARHTLATLLAGAGYSIEAVGSAEKAIESIKQGSNPEIALVDLDLPGMNGVDLISLLAVEKPGVFPVLITAASPERVALLNAPRVPHLRKPLDFLELLKVLERLSRSD